MVAQLIACSWSKSLHSGVSSVPSLRPHCILLPIDGPETASPLLDVFMMGVSGPHSHTYWGCLGLGLFLLGNLSLVPL